MCQRRTNEDGTREAWYAYLTRWACETVSNKPSAFITLFCCAFIFYMFKTTSDDLRASRNEYREFISEQTRVMMELTRQISEINARVQTLDKH